MARNSRKRPALPIVAEGAGDPLAILEQSQDGALHVHIDALMDAVILEGPDHLEAGTVSHVRQPGILVAAEIPLEDAAIRGAVEQRAPRLQLLHPGRRLLRMQLGHAPVVEILAAAHGVGEVDFPVVPVIHVRHCRGDSALRHHGVGLAQERLADHADLDTRRRGFDRRAEAGPSGTDHQDIVVEGLVLHQKILQSVQIPIEQSRT